MDWAQIRKPAAAGRAAIGLALTGAVVAIFVVGSSRAQQQGQDGPDAVRFAVRQRYQHALSVGHRHDRDLPKLKHASSAILTRACWPLPVL